MRKILASLFFSTSIILLLFFISSKRVFAGCEYYGGSECPFCSGSTRSDCSVSGNIAYVDYICSDTGGRCNGEVYWCDTGAEAQAICGGSGGGVCTPGNCSGFGCPTNCNEWNGDRNSCNSHGGCSWRDDNCPGGGCDSNICDGTFSLCDCYSLDKQNNEGNCRGSANCVWTSTAGQCIAGFPCSVVCGGGICPDACGIPIPCNTQPCPTASPTPIPTPTSPPSGAWFQTAGGDVHGNSDVGTNIPATCTIANICSPYFSIGKYLE